MMAPARAGQADGILWRFTAVALAIVFAMALAACGEDNNDVDATPTPIPDELRAAFAAWSDGEGWELIGPCELHPDPGYHCYMNVEVDNDTAQATIGRTASGWTTRLLLERQPDGDWIVTGATPIVEEYETPVGK